MRFEIGKSGSGSFEGRGESRKGSPDRTEDGGVEALLKRIWVAQEPREEVDGE